MDGIEIINQIANYFKTVLENKLVGIYLHGSLAFGDFVWESSDIDFLVVVRKPLTQLEKLHLIQYLLDNRESFPKKGVEMSVIFEKVLNPLQFPTPYELHFSKKYEQKALQNLNKFCYDMHGNDEDLAGYFMVLSKVGKVVTGEDINNVFPSIPNDIYLKSIMRDINDAKENYPNKPVYYLLNLCRTVAFLEDGAILSKIQGGEWGIKHLSSYYAPMIKDTIEAHSSGKRIAVSELHSQFVYEMLEKINQKIKESNERNYQLKEGSGDDLARCGF